VIDGWALRVSSLSFWIRSFMVTLQAHPEAAAFQVVFDSSQGLCRRRREGFASGPFLKPAVLFASHLVVRKQADLADRAEGTQKLGRRPDILLASLTPERWGCGRSSGILGRPAA